MDGGWFLPLQKAALVENPATVATVWGLEDNETMAYAAPVPVEALWSMGDGSHLASSADTSVGPCDLYPTCWFEKRFGRQQPSPSNRSYPPILALQSRFDSEQLHSIVDEDLNNEEHNKTSALPMLIRIERRVQSFGARMESSLKDAMSRARLLLSGHLRASNMNI